MDMNATTSNGKGWRRARRIVIGLAVFVTLVAVFYAEENWRGQRAWEQCKREVEARGTVLDWNKFLPPAIPDEQNFFTAPKMADWFVKPSLRAGVVDTPWQSRTELGRHLDPARPFAMAGLNASNGPIQIAEITFASPAGTENAMRLDDPATIEQVRRLISDTVGPSVAGSQGLALTAKKLRQIQPVQIQLQADRIPPVKELALWLGNDGVSANVGGLRIEAGADAKSFRVLLVPRPSLSAAEYLAWGEPAVPDFDLIREALKRPYAIIPGDYSEPFSQPIPNFVELRRVAQTLAQRAQCYLLSGQPDRAVLELALMHDLCRILEKPPAAKPETLVEAMIDVAITGLYVNTTADGFRLRAWQEPQLQALERQLQGVRLSPFVAEAFRGERAASTHVFETMSADQIADLLSSGLGGTKVSVWERWKQPLYLYLKFAPRGWRFQNLVKLARLEPQPADSFDLAQDTISPRVLDQTAGNLGKFFAHKSPFKTLVALAIPNFTRATQTLAFNQTQANEAQIVCDRLMQSNEFPFEQRDHER